MMEKELDRLWRQLDGKKSSMPHMLLRIRIDELRGLKDLNIRFDYPVSVIAGANATGKSTVLFAAACAYKVPNAGRNDFMPSTLFPNYNPRTGSRRDARSQATLDFAYDTPTGLSHMRWRRTKGWNRSYGGRHNGVQPERSVYLRTLSNLSNPSEVRGVLSMSRLSTPPEERPLTASQIKFAQQMLPFRYSDVVDLSSGSKRLLYAAQQDGTEYSELHMAAGERSILRLSQEIAQLNGALVLIDEVETGLHPWMQQLLMLQLQRLALRRDLQVIVTSHSPVVIDSVPRHARVHLERNDDGQVAVVSEPPRDVVQDALYGRSRDKLNVLCEDDAAEGVLHGVLDRLAVQHRVLRETVRIGRDTGAEEFPAHASAFKKFGLLDNFVFVLDGDKIGSNLPDKIRQNAGRQNAGREVPVLFLPGRHGPEAWVWDRLKRSAESGDSIAKALGIDPQRLNAQLRRLDSVYDLATDSEANIAKSKLEDLAEWLEHDVPRVCRVVSSEEAASPSSEIQPLLEEFIDAHQGWRSD